MVVGNCGRPTGTERARLGQIVTLGHIVILHIVILHIVIAYCYIAYCYCI
eukprot:SAG31_NODE_15132_length_769_cov_0.692537_1_plen_49_part_10